MTNDSNTNKPGSLSDLRERIRIKSSDSAMAELAKIDWRELYASADQMWVLPPDAAPDQVGDEPVWQREYIGAWSDQPKPTAHDRMVEEFSGGPKRELLPCDGDPACTWAATPRYDYDENLCDAHYAESERLAAESRATVREVVARVKRERYAAARNETGPSAVASAPPARPRIMVYCQGDSE